MSRPIVTLKIKMSVSEFKKFSDYLEAHEDDIASDINDFGDLAGIFRIVFEEPPKEIVY